MKKILAVVLAILMVVTFLPAAMAADWTHSVQRCSGNTLMTGKRATIAERKSQASFPMSLCLSGQKPSWKPFAP